MRVAGTVPGAMPSLETSSYRGWRHPVPREQGRSFVLEGFPLSQGLLVWSGYRPSVFTLVDWPSGMLIQDVSRVFWGFHKPACP